MSTARPRRPSRGGAVPRTGPRPAEAGARTGRRGPLLSRVWLPAPGQRGERFGLLLLVLVAAYLLSAFLSGAWVSAAQIVLFLGVATLAVRSGRLRRHTARLAIVVAVGGSLVALTLAITHSADAGAGVASLWAALVLLFAVVLIVRRLLGLPTVTLQSIYGAVSAYLIIGLMFAALYAAMYRFGNNSFFAHGSPGNIKTFQYFSFTTLTTLGYGDYTAAQSGGQAVAVMEALGGQIFLATLVARLVAAFRTPTRATDGRQRPRAAGRPARPARPPARTGPRQPRSTPARPATSTSSPGRGPRARRSRSHPER